LIAVSSLMIWLGKREEARRFTAMFIECSSRHPQPYWNMWARIVDAAAKVEDDAAAERVLSELQRDSRCSSWFLDALGSLNPRLVTHQATERALRGLAGAYTPEILRAYAARLLVVNAEDIARPEVILQQSLNVARRQGALSWELRTATTLAELWRRQG